VVYKGEKLRKVVKTGTIKRTFKIIITYYSSKSSKTQKVSPTLETTAKTYQ